VLSRIAGFSIKNSNKVLAFFIVATIAGLLASFFCSWDAIPDLSDPQVLLYAKVSGSPEQVSQVATQPMMERLAGLPEVEAVRGFSDPGYSYVTVVLDEKGDNSQTRGKIEDLVRGFTSGSPITWQVSHDTSGIGWVYQYSLSRDFTPLDLYDLRSLQEQVLAPDLARLDGVAEVATVGGYVKRFEILVNPFLLKTVGMTPGDLTLALEEREKELKGRMAMVGERDVILAFSGSAPMAEEGKIQVLEHAPVLSPAGLAALKFKFKGKEIALSEIATVQVAPDSRRGIADLDGKEEVVGGIVVARKGVDALALIRNVKAEIEKLKPSLSGVQVHAVYDRSRLIHASLSTIGWELFQELFLLSLVVTLFLGHYRSAVVLGLAFPAALSLCFIPFQAVGLTMNLMTLGGLAIAIGDMFDAGIILVENANRRLSLKGRGLGEAARHKELAAACSSLMKPLFFTLLIVVVSFLPVFALEGQMGRLFAPLAAAKTLGMLSALAVTLFLVPALCAKLLKGEFKREEQNKLSMKLRSLYRPSLEWALLRPWPILGACFLLMALTIPLFFSLPRQFLPSLNEGSLLYMPLTMPGVPADQVERLLHEADRRLKEFPEVESVFGKAGRAETATDPAPLFMIESTILLKPRSQWRSGMNEERLVSEMDAALQFLGVSNGWTQPIRGRIDMQATGIRTPLGLKISSSTLEKAEAAAVYLEKWLGQTPGVKSAVAERIGKAPSLEVTVDPSASKKWGLDPEQVLGQVLAFAGGAALGKAAPGLEGIPVAVVYPHEMLHTLDQYTQMPVFTPKGRIVPLGKLARVELGEGPDMVPLENGKPTVYLYLELDSKDTMGWIGRNRPNLEKIFPPESDVHLEISGQYLAEEKAWSRLKWLVPLCGLFIAALLALAFTSLREAGLILLSVPFAFLGGVWIQALLGIPLSVSVWVGYIALFAVAVQTGVVMVVYLKEALEKREKSGQASPETLRPAILEGSVLRLRPKLMTVATNVICFLPLLWTKGAGGDLLASVAAPIVGGMVTSAVHVLYITPILFYLTKGGTQKKPQPRPSKNRK
jgi:Cu(I)/Ag(I) efflux system membrane protein CusA/SilA